MSTRFSIAALISMMINAIVFGIGVTAVLSVPSLNADAAFWLPLVVALSFIVAPFIAWVLVPRLRSRWQRRQAARQRRIEDEGDDYDCGYRTVR